MDLNPHKPDADGERARIGKASKARHAKRKRRMAAEEKRVEAGGRQKRNVRRRSE